MELNGAKILYTIHTDIPLLGFVKLLNVGKPVYEICFFFANRTFHLLLLESFCV